MSYDQEYSKACHSNLGWRDSRHDNQIDASNVVISRIYMIWITHGCSVRQYHQPVWQARARPARSPLESGLVDSSRWTWSRAWSRVRARMAASAASGCRWCTATPETPESRSPRASKTACSLPPRGTPVSTIACRFNRFFLFYNCVARNLKILERERTRLPSVTEKGCWSVKLASVTPWGGQFRLECCRFDFRRGRGREVFGAGQYSEGACGAYYLKGSIPADGIVIITCR